MYQKRSSTWLGLTHFVEDVWKYLKWSGGRHSQKYDHEKDINVKIWDGCDCCRGTPVSKGIFERDGGGRVVSTSRVIFPLVF